MDQSQAADPRAVYEQARSEGSSWKRRKDSSFSGQITGPSRNPSLSRLTSPRQASHRAPFAAGSRRLPRRIEIFLLVTWNRSKTRRKAAIFLWAGKAPQECAEQIVVVPCKAKEVPTGVRAERSGARSIQGGVRVRSRGRDAKSASSAARAPLLSGRSGRRRRGGPGACPLPLPSTSSLPLSDSPVRLRVATSKLKQTVASLQQGEV